MVMNVFSSLFLVFILVSCSAINEKKHVLPFIGNYDIEYKLIDGKEVSDTVYPTIPYFYFLNDDSVIVKSTEMEGKVWVVDFFFTTCPTICPTMTKNMQKLNAATKDLHDELQFISISINPQHDTPSILKRYREHYKATASNWQFFTGKEAETHQLGIENFQIFARRRIFKTLPVITQRYA